MPEDSADPRVVPLHVALLARQHWGRAQRVPEPSCHGTCCVVFGTDNILHVNLRGHYGAFRAQIANAVGVQQGNLRILSSRPRVWNAAIDGFTCRSVIIVHAADPHIHDDIPWILVDARGLFLGWRAVPAPRGQISCRDVLDDLLRELGSGWRLWFRDLPQHADLLEVRTGQIFVVEVLYERLISPAGQIQDEQHEEIEDRPVDAPSSGSTGRNEPPSAGGETVESCVAAAGVPHSEPEDDGTDTDPPADIGDSESQGLQTDATFVEVPFLLLKPRYTHEWVSVRLPCPVTVPDALNAAALARHPNDAVRMPILCAVHPQPRSEVALTVCMPYWQHPGSVIAIDGRAANNRLFAVHVVGYCYRHDFLKLTGIDEGSDHEVFFRDLPWPLPADSPVSPENGDLVVIRPANAGIHVVHSLADRLQTGEGWQSCPHLPENLSDTAWVLGPSGPIPPTGTST